MNVVVTGSEGFLGRRVVSRLVKESDTVIAVDRISRAEPEHERVTYHQADLADATRLLPKVASSDTPFTLVHLAWDMRRHLGNEIQHEQVRQFAALLDHWESQGLEKLIVMGSAEEYGQRSGMIRETDEPEWPLSAYGSAKRSARDLAKEWAKKSGIPVIWLRPFILYGPGQRGDMLIPSAIHAAREKQMTAFTDGKQRRDFVYVDDVAEAIALCLNTEICGFQEFNLGCGKEIPVADILMMIARHYDAEAQFDLGARPRRPGEPEVQVADTSRAREVLGWEASVSCEEGIERLF